MKHRVLHAITVGSVFLFCLMIVVLSILPRWTTSRSVAVFDREIDPFHIETLSGQMLTSEDLKGHVVVLSFGATWCLPCRAELPEIETLAGRYSHNPAVIILAVDSGTEGDNATKAAAYLSKDHLTLPGAIDSLDMETSGPAAKSLGVPSLPAVCILDRSCNLRFVHSGYDSSEHLVEALSERIDSLL